MAKAKILVVDDDPEITGALQIILESNNFEVMTACCTAHARKNLQKSLPDLMILDIMMENMNDGLEFSKELKGNPATSKIPVILYTGIDAVTGVNFKSAFGETDQILADAYLEKPVDPRRLLAEIERLLSH